MIFDGHCHIWERWPYQPPVSDPDIRGSALRLVSEMDANGVVQALVVCAAIGENPRNADYAFAAARRYPGRLVVFPDIECRWTPQYRSPGAPKRLEEAVDRWDFKGFTQYLNEKEDGAWLCSAEGIEFFGLAAERGLVVSLSVMPHQMPAVCALADIVPGLVILCHHHAFLGPRTETTPRALEMVLAAAARPNIHVKTSGLGNVAEGRDEYPFAQLQWIPAALRRVFGAKRMIWGSDFPVSSAHMTYRQSLAIVREYGPFTDNELPDVLGRNISKLLDI